MMSTAVGREIDDAVLRSSEPRQRGGQSSYSDEVASRASQDAHPGLACELILTKQDRVRT